MPELSPAVDITSIIGVESVFRGSVADPWGRKLAGRFADFVVYSDVARFTMPIRAGIRSYDDPTLPALLAKLRSRDSSLFAPITCEIEETRTLNPDYLHDAFASFAGWARNSKGALHRWLRLHAEPWIRDGHLARVRPAHVFDLERLRSDPSVNELVQTLGLPATDIFYAFDIVLRYPLYGELVGSGSYFLAHPIRELQNLPTMQIGTGPAPSIAISFSDAVVAMAPRMSLDEYTAFLHEARGIVRDRRIFELQPGAVDKDTIREIASELGIPARLSGTGKVLGVAAGLLGMAGGPVTAVVGGAVSVASALWTGTVGSRPSRWNWLRWALEWDIEQQASDA